MLDVGIGKTKDNLPFLADGPILNVLMAKCRADGVVKYPQLVSFVGETSMDIPWILKNWLTRYVKTVEKAPS